MKPIITSFTVNTKIYLELIRTIKFVTGNLKKNKIQELKIDETYYTWTIGKLKISYKHNNFYGQTVTLKIKNLNNLIVSSKYKYTMFKIYDDGNIELTQNKIIKKQELKCAYEPMEYNFNLVTENNNVEQELEEEASPKRKERVCEENTISQKSISELIEDEIRKNSYLKSLHRDHHATFVDERQYLDLLMYMFSGIILIFILEQFIQIGIKMKTPIY